MKEDIKKEKLNLIQICNELGLNDNSRFFVEKKYKEEFHTKIEWEKLFKIDKLSY